MSAVTMQDVARVAGVSAMTVSNVVNGRPGTTEATRSRVLEAVAELGYEVNLTARQLRVGKTNTIALFVPTIEGAYFAELATHLSSAARDLGLRVAVETTADSAESELAAIRSSRLQIYDGAVVNLLRLDSDDLKDVEFSSPVVFIGEREMPGGFDHVMMDNVGGAHVATARLIELGARRIALIGGEQAGATPSMATLRTTGYHTALDEHGLAFDPRLIIPGRTYSMSDGYDAIRHLIAADIEFDGVLALTDTAAIGAVRALADENRSVPDDVQVVGFDNIPELDFFIPRISSVDPGTKTIAQTALEMLVKRISGVRDFPPTTATPARARLVERESTI